MSNVSIFFLACSQGEQHWNMLSFHILLLFFFFLNWKAPGYLKPHQKHQKRKVICMPLTVLLLNCSMNYSIMVVPYFCTFIYSFCFYLKVPGLTLLNTEPFRKDELEPKLSKISVTHKHLCTHSNPDYVLFVKSLYSTKHFLMHLNEKIKYSIWYHMSY